jgi:hypothetical protein
VPYGTDSRLDRFQAINCLATIITSLRDRKSTLTPVRKIEATPLFEHEHEGDIDAPDEGLEAYSDFA